MATAKRVKVPSKNEPTLLKYSSRLERVVSCNGVVTSRTPASSVVDLDWDVSTDNYVPQLDRIILEMSLTEVETLCIVGARIGGHPNGRRGDIDAIFRALNSVDCPVLTFHPDIDSVSTGIAFRTARTPSPNQGTGASASVGKEANPAGCGQNTTPTRAGVTAQQTAQRKADYERGVLGSWDLR